MILREPPDGWGKGIEPRKWQARSLPVVLRHYSQEKPCNAIIRGTTGSGKSILAAQIIACCQLEQDEVIVVSTSTRYLVKQLKETLQHRLEGDVFMSRQLVGAFFTEAKDYLAPIIVACTPSLQDLATILAKLGKKVVLWILDECHRCTSNTVRSAEIALRAEKTLGMTATPWLANDKKRLTLFEKLIINYSPREALDDGVIVIPRFVPWEGGEADLDMACLEMTELATGPGMYNATNINDLRLFNHKAKDHGIALEGIHSKMSEADGKDNLKRLQGGALKAITHVSMLQEGADFPWLYWLCMRRPITSRTRYAQEIGRVVRSYTDPITGVKKEEAVIYDPHGLADIFALSYEALLGGEFDDDVLDESGKELTEAERVTKQLEQSVFDIMEALTLAKKSKNPLSKTALATYLGQVVQGFDMAELLSRKLASREWRAQSASAKQMQTIQNMLWTLTKKVVPLRHQRALSLLTQHGPSMNKGVASDLISIQMSLAQMKQWPTIKNLERAAEEGIDRHEAQQAAKQKLITHGTMAAPPTPMTRPEIKTPAEIKKAVKEAEKKLPSLFD